MAAHASLKCYIYASLRKHRDGVPDEYQTLLPLFQKSSSVLGKYWIHTLKDYSYISLCLSPKRKVSMDMNFPDIHGCILLSRRQTWIIMIMLVSSEFLSHSSCTLLAVESVSWWAAITCCFFKVTPMLRWILACNFASTCTRLSSSEFWRKWFHQSLSQRNWQT